MKHLKLYEDNYWKNESVDLPEDWEETDDNDQVKIWEIKYYEVPHDAHMFASPEYTKSEYVEGTSQQVEDYILSKTYKKRKTVKKIGRRANGTEYEYIDWLDEYEIKKKYKKDKFMGFDYTSHNGAIKVKEHKIKIKKL